MPIETNDEERANKNLSPLEMVQEGALAGHSRGKKLFLPWP